MRSPNNAATCLILGNNVIVTTPLATFLASSNRADIDLIHEEQSTRTKPGLSKLECGRIIVLRMQARQGIRITDGNDIFQS
jgi:hypothetical protein